VNPIENLKDIFELSEEEWKVMKSLMQKLTLEKDATLFIEGSEEDEIYYLESGNLAVIKQDRQIASLSPGDWVGEIAAMKSGGKRSASVEAKERSALWRVSMEDLKKTTEIDPRVFIKVISHLFTIMGDRLAQSNASKAIAVQRQLDLAKIRVVMGQFLCYILFALTAFFYAVKIISVLDIKPKVSTALSIPLLLLLSYFLILFIKKSGYALNEFGLTMKNCKSAIVESIIVTIPLALFLLLIKWTFFTSHSFFDDKPLFYFNRLIKMHLGIADWLLITVGYALFVPVQSLMVNGCLQGTLEKLFVGPKKTFLSILLSNLIFSTLHLQLSLTLACGVFVIGCFWGWLYSRHRNIIGISISHAIIGIWVGVFLGVQ
jgi:CRP-like cAMP-binding protein